MPEPARPKVFLVAWQHGTGSAEAILVLRKVFALSLLDAWQVLKREAPPEPELDNTWSVIVFDRHTGAPVWVQRRSAA